MIINDKGLALIKEFEGLYLKAYKDMVGVWTIGWGATEGVYEGQEITEQEAEDMLRKELSEFEAGVSKLVRVNLTDNQFSSLVSFSYNLGLGSLGESKLLRYLNDGDYDLAAQEFHRWNRAGGVEVLGLTRRRLAERDLFLS